MAGRKLRQKGAALLDQKLVNDTLHWLRGAGYDSVLKPFEKGLHHLLEAHIKKDGLSDVITDMYEAVEALAKKVTGRDKDLSEIITIAAIISIPALQAVSSGRNRYLLQIP
jgi:hypothetical protein